MEQNTTNKTALKYREWIVAAFMDLLKQYSYQEITIKQIVLQADVSRQTFYRHFKSKEVTNSYKKVVKSYKSI